MAARIVRTSVLGCVRLQVSLANFVNSRCLGTSHALFVRGAKPQIDRDERRDEPCADEDFYGIASDRGVVTIDDPLGDKQERLRRFSHLTRRRDAKVSDQLVVEAGFGTIRYDSDNRARYHGQYEDDRPLDDLVLGMYEKGSVSESKRKRRSAVQTSEESPQLKTQEKTPASARKAAKRAQKMDVTGDTSKGVTTFTHNEGDLALLKAKPSAGARAVSPQASPADVEGLASLRVDEKQSLKSKEALSRAEVLATTELAGDPKGQFEIQDSSPLGSHVRESSFPEKSMEPKKYLKSAEIFPEGHRESGTGDFFSPDARFADSPAVSADSVHEDFGIKSELREPRKASSKGRATASMTRDSHGASGAGNPRGKQLGELSKAAGEYPQESPTEEASSGASRRQGKVSKKTAKNIEAGDKATAKDASSNVAGEANPTAHEYLRKPESASLKLDSKGFLILKSEVRPNLHTMLRSEAVDMLRKRVLYDANDLLILDKPYGMICHGPAEGVPDACVLSRLLPDLSSALYHGEDIKLHTVHRLDRDVTGVLVLAKTQRMADVLQTLFEEHNIIKTYHAITFGVPDRLDSTIDMPLAEGSVGSCKRMVICPKLDPEFERLVPKFKKTYEAITKYRVLSSHGRAAYIEVKPVTGVKHQIRVHLGFGLRCPILGDHKYSHLRYMGPQRLSGDMLTRLNVRQPKARHIPMHLHALSILIPEILDGRNLTVRAHLPHHFVKNLKRLNLHKY
ncbi:uncharacterized protein LOC144104646 [Amblyomma americanum]